MSRYAECDNCGDKDDMNYGSGPILVGGVVLQFRAADGDDIDCKMDLCQGCRQKLLKLMPKLQKVLGRS